MYLHGSDRSIGKRLGSALSSSSVFSFGKDCFLLIQTPFKVRSLLFDTPNGRGSLLLPAALTMERLPAMLAGRVAQRPLLIGLLLALMVLGYRLVLQM